MGTSDLLGKKPGMAHGVTPKIGGKLLDGKEDKEDVFEDAMMEVQIDESATAATAGEEEKMTPADAEVPGSKAEEANTEEGWRRVGGEGEERSDRTVATVDEAAGVQRGPPANFGSTCKQSSRGAEARRAGECEVVRSARIGPVSLFQIAWDANPDE